MNPLAYSIVEACTVARAGRTALYEAIKAGELRAVKRGRKTLILVDDLACWVKSHPSIKSKESPAALATPITKEKVIQSS